MKKFKKGIYRCAVFLGLSLLANDVLAQLKMPAVFSDNMVLQRNQQDPIWGTAIPGEVVYADFLGKHYHVRADSSGKWSIKLKSHPEGGPYQLNIATAKDTIRFKNILIGEVWLCSGQSNMEMPLEGWPNKDGTYRCRVLNFEQEIADAAYPQIRLLQQERQKTETAQSDIKVVGKTWRECSPESVRTFSATAYFFARDVYKKTGIPIGLIESAVGGSVIKSWIDVKLTGARDGGMLYNGMIAPVIPYGIRGVLWYQGEFNTQHAWEYQSLFSKMIVDWRKKWKQGCFPFYYMQLPVFADTLIVPVAVPSAWAELREAQFKTLSVPNTAMAVSIDLPDNDLHPANKQDFGHRFALIALSKLYGQKNSYVGPLYSSFKKDGHSIRLFFSNPEGGLSIRNGAVLRGFSAAGADSTFRVATARIEGNSIVVASDEVPDPLAVRYAWSENPVNNLVNKAGLPASPFRTDDWPFSTRVNK